MPVSMQMVRDALDPEEPRYAEAAQLGTEAIPHLQVLIRGDDPMLASKAVYLASLIPDEQTPSLLQEAAQHSDPVVRVAAAAALSNVPDTAATDALLQLLVDEDPGVRKVARAAVPENPPEAILDQLRAMPYEPGGATAPGREVQPLPVDQPMPGESALSGLMPGESGGRMPGETTGAMPGERAATGGMPN